MSDLIYCTYFKHIWEREEKYANNKLKDSDLTFTQSNALEYICRGEGQTTQKDLENYMEIRHSAVVGIVSRLESKNLIFSFEDSADRRQKILKATPKGERLNLEIQKDKERVENRVISGFSEEEQRILSSMLERVYKNLAE